MQCSWNSFRWLLKSHFVRAAILVIISCYLVFGGTKPLFLDDFALLFIVFEVAPNVLHHQCDEYLKHIFHLAPRLSGVNLRPAQLKDGIEEGFQRRRVFQDANHFSKLLRLAT